MTRDNEDGEEAYCIKHGRMEKHRRPTGDVVWSCPECDRMMEAEEE